MQTDPQENNNFETIISTWRRLSGELIESPAFTSMSGDSPSHPFKKKEEDSNLPMLDQPKGSIATVASAGAVVTVNDKLPTQDNTDTNNSDEKKENQELTKQEKEETKDAAGDADFDDDDKDNKSFLENEHSKFSESKPPNEKGDKVDSVYLRPPPPHKVRSNTSTADDDDCGIKCLYYTLQCCDCVLM